MQLNLTTRETKFTDAEFDAIERNSEGRIIDDFDLVACFLTEAQVERLHSDDWSRYGEWEEEMRCLIAEFL